VLESVIQFFQHSIHDPGWITFLLAMTPIGELRIALPWGITYGHLTWVQAYFWAISGNFLIAIPLIYLLEPVSSALMLWGPGERFFSWLFARTRRKGQLIETWEFIGLMIFVGIPLPVTGAWTGAVAGFLFGLAHWKSLAAILCGLFMSATIVTLITLTGVRIFG